MLWFIISIILFLAAIGLSAAAVFGDKKNRFGMFAGGTAVGVLALLVMLLSTMRSVPVHSVGVKTSFGKIESSLRPGVHWLNAPWSTVYVLDETVQTTQFYGDGKTGNCMQVRIGGQQLACLNITIQWQVEDQAAPGLFNQYDNQGTDIMTSLRNNVVITDLRSVANQVMGDYNPIADVSLTATANASSQSANARSQFSTFGPQILTDMRNDLANQIHIKSITLSNAYYNGTTESRLASVANQYAETAIAQQQILTDEALATANDKLAKSLTPQIVQNTCLTVTQDIIKSGGKPDNGWSCYGSTPVVAGS